jgi:hypothetical protein
MWIAVQPSVFNRINQRLVIHVCPPCHVLPPARGNRPFAFRRLHYLHHTPIHGLRRIAVITDYGRRYPTLAGGPRFVTMTSASRARAPLSEFAIRQPCSARSSSSRALAGLVSAGTVSLAKVV